MTVAFFIFLIGTPLSRARKPKKWPNFHNVTPGSLSFKFRIQTSESSPANPAARVCVCLKSNNKNSLSPFAPFTCHVSVCGVRGHGPNQNVSGLQAGVVLQRGLPAQPLAGAQEGVQASTGPGNTRNAGAADAGDTRQRTHTR